MQVSTIKDVKTEDLIQELRTNAKRLVEDSTLYTVADLMREAANRLEKRCKNDDVPKV